MFWTRAFCLTYIEHNLYYAQYTRNCAVIPELAMASMASILPPPTGGYLQYFLLYVSDRFWRVLKRLKNNLTTEADRLCNRRDSQPTFILSSAIWCPLRPHSSPSRGRMRHQLIHFSRTSTAQRIYTQVLSASTLRIT